MKRPGAFRNSHTSMGGSRVLLIVKCFSVFHDTIPANCQTLRCNQLVGLLETRLLPLN